MKDYILYIHGVNTRNDNYAKKLENAIAATLANEYKIDGDRQLVHVSLFWGDIHEFLISQQLEAVKKSEIWKHCWAKSLRVNLLWPFSADAVMYLNPTAGAAIVDKVCQQALQGLRNFNLESDVLHLVGHSWGSVILFDLLFANHWFERKGTVAEQVQLIRKKLGMVEHEEKLKIGSIHTLGSPIALFSLMQAFTSSEIELSNSINSVIKQTIPWFNYVHPGDLIAYPLSKVDIIDQNLLPVQIHDIDIAKSDMLIRTKSQFFDSVYDKWFDSTHIWTELFLENSFLRKITLYVLGVFLGLLVPIVCIMFETKMDALGTNWINVVGSVFIFWPVLILTAIFATASVVIVSIYVCRNIINLVMRNTGFFPGIGTPVFHASYWKSPEVVHKIVNSLGYEHKTAYAEKRRKEFLKDLQKSDDKL